MAIYHLTTSPIRRVKGRTATAAAAYRAADKVIDEKSQEVHDYTKKRGVVDRFILVPQGEKRPTRAALWNMAEGAEKRADARVAREWEVSLPHEIPPHERKALAGDIARYLVERYGVAADVSIHAPTGKGDDRNFHAHILTTTRKLEGGQLTQKAEIELDNKQTKARGIALTTDQIKEVRAMWAGMVNRQLRRVNAPEIDHRSHKERGLETLPTIHLGPKVTHLERGKRPFRTERGDRNRKIQAYNAIVLEKQALERKIAHYDEVALEVKRLEERQAIIEEWPRLHKELAQCRTNPKQDELEDTLLFRAKRDLKEYEDDIQRLGIFERAKRLFEIRGKRKELQAEVDKCQAEIDRREALKARGAEIAARIEEIRPIYEGTAAGQEMLRQQRQRALEAEAERAREAEERARRQKEREERERNRPKTQQKDMGRGR